MMKRKVLFVGVSFLSHTLFAQNVGIGTTTPTSTLEIKNPVKSVVKISSHNFEDTSQLIFSNRNNNNQGTDIQITNIKETGLRVSSKSDLSGNNKDTIMQITPAGLVGIRTATPQYPLDVKGDMNVTGELKANGSSGENGQFLQSNGNGTMSWVNKDRFKKFKVFRNNGSSSPTLSSIFTFPTGVTEVAVEIWGGGGPGSANGAGASGGYLFAIIPVGSYTFLTANVGAGGRCNFCTDATRGESSAVTLPGGALVLTGSGGYADAYRPSAGNYSATGTYLNNVSFVGIEGQSAKAPEIFYENTPSGYYVFNRNASGGDAPLRPGSGGRSGWNRKTWDGSMQGYSPIASDGHDGSEPGGGGGFPLAKGGGGLIIVYW